MPLFGAPVDVTVAGATWKPTRWVLGSTMPSPFLSAGGQIAEAGNEWRLMVKVPVSNSSLSVTLETGEKAAPDLVLEQRKWSSGECGGLTPLATPTKAARKSTPVASVVNRLMRAM